MIDSKFVFMASFASCLILNGALNADPMTAPYSVKVTNAKPHGYTAGGPFHMDVQGSDDDYDTFCLERNEYINNGGTTVYQVYDIGLNIYENKKDIALGAIYDPIKKVWYDPLDNRTAYLYFKYRTDPLYADSGPERDDIQNAIWMIEQDIPLVVTNPYYIDAMNNAGAGDYLKVVQVANLRETNWTGWITERQSMLTYLGGVPIPEVTTVCLLGLAFCGGFLARRRK